MEAPKYISVKTRSCYENALVQLLSQIAKDFSSAEFFCNEFSILQELRLEVKCIFIILSIVSNNLLIGKKKLNHADDAICVTPTWIGKGLTCVCFKRKGHYERICINLTPQQASKPAIKKLFCSLKLVILKLLL